MTRLDEIRARLEAATPGPWSADYWHGDPLQTWAVTDDAGVKELAVADELTEADALLIAHAPEDLRILLAVAEAAAEWITRSDEWSAIPLTNPAHSVAHKHMVEQGDVVRAALAALDEGPA